MAPCPHLYGTVREIRGGGRPSKQPGAGEHLFKDVYHSKEGFEAIHIPAFVILGEKGAVPETVVENGFIRPGCPEPEIRQPQLPDRSDLFLLKRIVKEMKLVYNYSLHRKRNAY
mgnify:CR=1 FL=1